MYYSHLKPLSSRPAPFLLRCRAGVYCPSTANGKSRAPALAILLSPPMAYIWKLTGSSPSFTASSVPSGWACADAPFTPLTDSTPRSSTRRPGALPSKRSVALPPSLFAEAVRNVSPCMSATWTRASPVSWNRWRVRFWL